MKNNKRRKIIPDKVFKKIWNKAAEYEDIRLYIDDIMLNKKIFDQDKYKISYTDTYYMLKNIYIAYHTPLKEFLDKQTIKKSEISNIFCIPIRTVEDWYYGKSTPPSYIKLMIFRHYHRPFLGKYISLQSEMDHISTYPAIYKKHERKTPVSEEINEIKINRSDYLLDMSDDEYDEFIENIVNRSSK